MRALIIFAGIFGIALLLWFAGCSKDNSDVTGNNSAQAPEILNIVPADGASNVQRNSGISIKFNMPMDTLSVMTNFHFSGGAGMHEWMDSLEYNQIHGGMGNMMNMEHMMHWMDSIHIGGEFRWNYTMDSCSYEPDSLMPNTEYMIYMNGDIMSHNGTMMDMHNYNYGGSINHFTTGP
jgi:hypothetical protein